MIAKLVLFFLWLLRQRAGLRMLAPSNLFHQALGVQFNLGLTMLHFSVCKMELITVSCSEVLVN